jgi:hypothetical protein
VNPFQGEQLPPLWALLLALLLAVVVLVPILDWWRERVLNYATKARIAWRSAKLRMRKRLRRSLDRLMRDNDDPSA